MRKHVGWRRTKSRCGGRRAVAQAWPALFLTVLMVFPVPVSAQVPLGMQGPSAGQALDQGAESPLLQRSLTPRTLQEPWAFPTITIVDPRNGAVVNREDQPIVIAFRDPRDEIDLQSLQIWVNGVDRTREFQVTAREATWTPRFRRGEGTTREQEGEARGPAGAWDATGPRGPGAQGLPGQPSSPSLRLREGQNTIVASIKNLNGNMATASSAFVFDLSIVLTTRPTPRSPLERGFLQPPAPSPTDRTVRRAPSEPPITRDLVQFGYEAFRTFLPSVTPAANLPVDPQYRLGPGDGLILYVWNIPGTALYESTTLNIDRTGAAFIPRIGSVPLQGLTVAQAQEVIRARVARNYAGFELRLALGELRAVSVYVMGEVARPGTYTVSPFSTVLDALFLAGGPTKMGSLRSIRVTQPGGQVGEVDLYDFFLRGERPSGPMLQAGDTVFVPPIGPVAGVTGEVKRPGIYEIRPGTTVGMLVAMAGGVLPTARLERVQVERTQGPSGKAIIDLPFVAGQGQADGDMLRDGDLVTVFPGYDYLRNVVTLEGFVRSPGRFEWKSGMRVSDLLTPAMLLPEAYQEKVEIARVRADFSREILHVDVRSLWASGGKSDPARDIELKPQDRINVHSEVIGPKIVTLSGEVRRPGVYAVATGERLSSVLQRAGGFLPTAFPKGGIFIRESLRLTEQAELERFAQTQFQSILAEGSAISAGAAESGRPEYAGAQAAIAAQRRELVQSLTRAVTLGRLTIRLDEPARLVGSPDDIEMEDGDTLHIPQRPTSVSILGAVRYATAILYQPEENIEYYLARAGGATRQADLEQAYILKPDGIALASFVKMRKVEAGDAIIVPVSTEGKIPTIMWVKDITTIIGNIALPFGVIAGLFK